MLMTSKWLQNNKLVQLTPYLLRKCIPDAWEIYANESCDQMRLMLTSQISRSLQKTKWTEPITMTLRHLKNVLWMFFIMINIHAVFYSSVLTSSVVTTWSFVDVPIVWRRIPYCVIYEGERRNLRNIKYYIL